MDDRFEIAVGAGTLASTSNAVVRFPHRWAPAGQLTRLLEVVDQVAEIPQAKAPRPWPGR